MNPEDQTTRPPEKKKPGRIKKPAPARLPFNPHGFVDKELTDRNRNGFANARGSRVALLQEMWNKNTITVLAAALGENPPDFPFQTVIRQAREAVREVFSAGADRVPLVLAYSFHTPNVRAVAESVAQVRAAGSTGPLILVAGGAHASGDPEGTLKLGFDFVVAGEGEESITLFLDALHGGADPGAVQGAVRFGAGGIECGPPPRSVDLEKFPPMAHRIGRIAPIEISRGCPWGCAYCQTSSLMGRTMRHRSVDWLAPWIERARALRMYDLRLLTPNAFAYGSADGKTPDPGAMERLLVQANRVFGKQHSWYGAFPSEVRPDSVTADALDLVSKYTITKDIVLGAQSGSDRMLESLGRGHTAGDVVRAVELIAGRGFRPVVDFIFGLPGETDEDSAETRAVMERITAMGAVIHSHAFMPLPGTKLWGRPLCRIAPETTRLLGELGRTGKHFGQWQVQVRKAEGATDVFPEENR